MSHFNVDITIEGIKEKLLTLLIGGFQASSQNVTESNFTKHKGLYFWFMDPKAYHVLSKKGVQLSPLENCIKKDGFDLVYLGTAGTRNNKSDSNNSNILERIKWHVSKNQSKSCVCSGTMSTFRRTIGPLLSDDLIIDDDKMVQREIDRCFEQYFKIWFIPYPGDFMDVKDDVNLDEQVLIKSLTPLFNIDKNPNCKIVNHITSLISIRRKIIERSTKNRLHCPKTKSGIQKELAALTKKKPGQLLAELQNKYLKHYAFEVVYGQSIHSVVNSIGLKNQSPKGPCEFILYDPLNDTFVFEPNPRSTGKGTQNLFSYFNNTQGKSIKKSVRILDEMRANNISTIRVEVFYDD